jgi:hypothetical protein
LRRLFFRFETGLTEGKSLEGGRDKLVEFRFNSARSSAFSASSAAMRASSTSTNARTAGVISWATSGGI